MSKCPEPIQKSSNLTSEASVAIPSLGSEGSFATGPSKKILFAAGGTGGHLFPAQALAEQLLKQRPDITLLFAGAKLSGNAYFDQSKFSYQEILSTTPFRGGVLKMFKSLGTLFRGVCESLRLLKHQKPDVIVGFGSFHAFPVLCAAALKGIPMILFESNAIPGKVIRLFSKRALLTGIFFSEAQAYLKGRTVEVEIPKKPVSSHSEISQREARRQFLLDPDRLTLLVFGGSQGAQGINKQIGELISLLHQRHLSFQLIHFTGSQEMTTLITACCQHLNIPCYIRDFEPQMNIAWSAADVVICRSGAMTLSELLHYEVPGILIPYPFAADQHQLKNALHMEKKVGGAVHFVEKDLSAALIAETLIPLTSSDPSRRIQMKQAIKNFKAQQKKADLGSLILEIIDRV